MTTILFNAQSPKVYRIGDIYDPDAHGDYPTEDGKVVPSIGSILIDGTALFTVIKVNPITLKTTYKPSTVVTTVGDGGNEILSYGNDKFMLYFDNRNTPTKLIVDSRYSDTSGTGVEYTLVKVDEEGGRKPISLYVDTQDAFAGERIPMVETAIEGIPKCANCYTLDPLVEGEMVELEIYDNAGVLTTIVKLTSKKANVLNDFGSEVNPVVDFIAGASQESGDEWLLYVGQDPDDLAIWLKLVFADGSLQNIAVDNLSCFMYGFDQIESNFPCKKFTVLFKYFLPKKVPTTLPIDLDANFITLTKTVFVDSKTKTNFSKISPMLFWNQTTASWDIKYFAYFQTRDTFEDVTALVTYSGEAFDPSMIGVSQDIVIVVPNNTGDPTVPIEDYTQHITIRLNTPLDMEPYLTSETGDTMNVYGTHAGTIARPVIRYDAALEQYFIPNSLFSSKEVMVNFFYTRAAAPWLAAVETQAPVPTHFTIREITSRRLLLAEPMSMDNYTTTMTFLTTSQNSAAQFVDATVAVEFLTEDSGSYSILYGVPVDVGTGNYNG